MRSRTGKQLLNTQQEIEMVKHRSKKHAVTDRAPMGYRDGGKIKGFMPCAECKAPKACKAAGMCMAKAKR